VIASRAPSRPWWERYVGLPFGEGTGEVTCWGLVRLVYADRLGLDLPAYGEISARDLIRVSRTMEAAKDDGWRSPAVPEAHDVVLMRAAGTGNRVVHVGVMVDRAQLLHVEAASAAVVVPVQHWSVAGRILGWRRRA